MYLFITLFSEPFFPHIPKLPSPLSSFFLTIICFLVILMLYIPSLMCNIFYSGLFLHYSSCTPPLLCTPSYLYYSLLSCVRSTAVLLQMCACPHTAPHAHMCAPNPFLLHTHNLSSHSYLCTTRPGSTWGLPGPFLPSFLHTPLWQLASCHGNRHQLGMYFLNQASVGTWLAAKALCLSSLGCLPWQVVKACMVERPLSLSLSLFPCHKTLRHRQRDAHLCRSPHTLTPG